MAVTPRTGTPRRLMLVTPYFPPEGGGLERYAYSLAQELSRTGRWTVSVVTTGAQRSGILSEAVDGLTVHRLPHEFRLSNTRLGLRWRRQLRQLVADLRPDVINAHAPVPGLADLVARVCGELPLVVTYHAGSMRKHNWRLDAVIVPYERVVLPRLLRRAAWIVPTSDDLRDNYLRRFRGQSSVVTPAVDPDRFVPAQARAADTVLFVGGMNPGDRHKGLDALLDAVGRIVADGRPRVRLDIVGRGTEEARYRALAARLGLTDRVRFRGHLNGEALAEAYRAAGVLALPTRNDNWPLVILEAMASGLPVVATEVGAIPEMITDGAEGWLVPVADANALVARLARVLDRPEESDRMGAAGRRKITGGLTWTAQSSRMEQILDAVVDGRPVDARRRVAIVTPYFAPKIGGLETYAQSVARGLQAGGGHRVIVVTSNHAARRFTVEDADGLTVYRLPVLARVSNTPINPLWPLAIRRVLKDNRIEALNVHTPVPFMAESAMLASRGRRLVLTYHAGSMKKGNLWVDLAISGYERVVLPSFLGRVDQLVAVSPAVADWLRRRSGRESIVLPPAVDGSIFHVVDRGQPDQTQEVLFVGRIELSSAWKGIGVLLQAFAQVADERPEPRLVLVGDGDARRMWEGEVAAAGLAGRVEFRGSLRGRVLADAYRRARCSVLPSLTEAESFGMALIESMACGTPVIGSRIGGIPAVIDDGVDGLLVPPGDAAALAGAIRHLLDDRRTAERMGQAGAEKVAAGYLWPSRVAAYGELLGAAGGKQPAGQAP